MFKQLDFTHTGGLYVYQETLDWLQTAYSQLLDGLAASYGNKLIISGVTPAGGNVSDGWVVVNGEILPFVGGAVATYVYIDEQTTDEQYDDATSKPAYIIRRVRFTAVPNGTSFNYTDLVRLPFTTAAAPTLKDALTVIQNTFKQLINLEPCVILSGCVVSAVTTGPNTCTISAGTVMINGNIVAAPLRTAATYPCYLKPDGTYVTADPGGDRIKFDPYTSQYYVDVLKRKTHYTGEVLMSRNASDLDYFDTGTGLGKWRWLGWQLCNDMRSRSPLGYDPRTAQPGGADSEAWDASYNTIGNFGGEKKHALNASENGPHTHEVKFNKRGVLTIAGDEMSTNPIGAAGSIISETSGTGAAHNTIHPYRVTLFIERI